MHNIILSEGYNFVGLHGQPYTNTFLGVFGNDTNFWPASPSAGSATRIEFYSSGPNSSVSDRYFLHTDGNWYATNGVAVTTNQQASNFFLRGFSITLPRPLPTQYVTTTALDNAQPGSNIAAMVWHPVLKVPTNGPGGGSFSHVIRCGVTQGRTNTVLSYNVVSLNLPVAAHPSQMRLLESGFVKGAFGKSDEIYTVNTAIKGVPGDLKMYCDTNNVWKFGTSEQLVPWGYFKPNDVIVIVSKNGGTNNTWTWTYDPTNFYTLPTRWMGQ